jgi:hypothetical protein
MGEGDLARQDRVIVRHIRLRVVASVLELNIHPGAKLLEIKPVPLDADCVADPLRLFDRRSA